MQVQSTRNFLETRFLNFRPRSKRTTIEIRTWEKKMVWSSGRGIGAKKNIAPGQPGADFETTPPVQVVWRGVQYAILQVQIPPVAVQE